MFHCGFVYSGGGERIVLQEAKELMKRGYAVEVWAPTLDERKCFPEDVATCKVKTFLPQLPSFFLGRFALQMLLSSLFAPLFAYRFRHCDIFIGENQPGAWIAFCVAKMLKKPYIVYMNQPNRLLYPRTIDTQVKWENLRDYYFVHPLLTLCKPFVAWADRISFTKSKTMLLNGGYIGRIIESIYRKKGVVCPAGTRIIPKNQVQNQTQIFQGTVSIANKKNKKCIIRKPYILLTNRHVPQKKFDYAIMAMQTVVKQFPKVQLVIPGPFTAYTKELQLLSTTLGLDKHILFLDQIAENELQKLYRNACVYVYTAPDEDFGMGVIEAMGAGVPVIAWNFAGPTVTVVNGKTGYLAKPYVVKEYGEKMLAVLSDKKHRLQLSQNAWEHANTYFSWQHHTDILEKEIKKVLTN